MMETWFWTQVAIVGGIVAWVSGSIVLIWFT